MQKRVTVRGLIMFLRAGTNDRSDADLLLHINYFKNRSTSVLKDSINMISSSLV